MSERVGKNIGHNVNSNSIKNNHYLSINLSNKDADKNDQIDLILFKVMFVVYFQAVTT